MTIRRLLSSAIVFLVVLVATLAGLMAYGQYAAIKDTETANLRLAVIRAFADLPRYLNTERGFVTLAVQSIAPGESAKMAPLKDLNAATDKAFATALQRTAETAQLDDAKDIAAIMNQMKQVYDGVRRDSEANFAKPIAARGDAEKRLSEDYFRINTLVTTATRAQLSNLSSVNGKAYGWGLFAATVWDLRNVAGRQAGQLQGLIIDRKVVSPAQRLQYDRLQAQVDMIWDAISTVGKDDTTPAAVKRAIADLDKAYNVEFGVIKKDAVAQFDTGNFPIDGAAFRSIAVPMWEFAVKARDAAYDAAAQEIAVSAGKARTSLSIAVACAIVALGFGFAILLLVSRRVIRPMQAMTQAIVSVADGQLDAGIPGIGRSDEIGSMASAVQVFKDSLARNQALEAETVRSRETAEAERRTTMQELATLFEQEVGSIVTHVSSAADALKGTAEGLAISASDSIGRSGAVAAAAEQVSGNVSQVAATTEELRSSVEEISRQVEQSAAMSHSAVEAARETSQIVADLSQAAGKISDIVGLISNIAGQTNLLALNATIEAARAGEAGRGFAVVAAEVKELATQTAKATADIADQINAIQDTTGKAVTAIGGITTTIQTMNDYATAIAGAVAEQGAATSEIVRSVTQASAGTSEVTQNFAKVAETVQEVGASADHMRQSSVDLSVQSTRLKGEVSRLLDTIRAA